MVVIVSLISTLFIMLILVLLLEYRSRNRRALARRMRIMPVIWIFRRNRRKLNHLLKGLRISCVVAVNF